MAAPVQITASLNPHASAAPPMETPMVEIDRLSLWYGAHGARAAVARRPREGRPPARVAPAGPPAPAPRAGPRRPVVGRNRGAHAAPQPGVPRPVLPPAAAPVLRAASIEAPDRPAL